MPEIRRSDTAPWIVAAIAGAALVALLVVYFVIFRPDQRDADARRAADRTRVVGQFSATEKAAMNAAATDTANLVSFRRANFEADFQRALDGTTGALRSDLVSKKATTLKQLTDGKFDLSAKITHTALESPTQSGKSTGYIVLVTFNGYRSTALTVPIQQQLAVTELYVKDKGKNTGKWLAAGVTSIGVSS
jgi:hypothetical protein